MSDKDIRTVKRSAAERAATLKDAEQADLGALLTAEIPVEVTYAKGQEVTGSVIRFSADAAFLSLKGNREGVLPLAPFIEDGKRLTLSVGESVTATVRVTPADSGPVLLSPQGGTLETETTLTAATEKPAPVEAAPIVVEEEEEDFAALLADHLEPQRRLADGDEVVGEIVKVGKDSLFIAMNAKSEGIISIDEFKNADGEMTVKLGDEIKAYVVDARGEDGIRLSRTVGVGRNALDSIIDAFEAGIPVEGVISGRNKGGFEVKLGSVRGFLPLSKLDLHRIEEDQLDSYIGQTFRYKVMRVKGRDVVLSRADLLKEESAGDIERIKAELKEGSVVTGRVRSLKDYGAFIELAPGLDGLLHISEMSWARVSNPEELLTVGQEITVIVLKYDPETSRLSLGLKQLGGDPWTRVNELFKEGQLVDGRVERLTKFGAFIELGEGIDGLLHISNMSWEKRISKPSDVVKVGDSVQVQILNIDTETRRIGLGLKQLRDDPWSGIEEQFIEGTEHEGTVEKIERFGVFLTMAPGITGLMPMSESDTKPGTDLSREFPVGSTVKVLVLELNTKTRRLTLSRKALNGARNNQDFRQYKDRQAAKSKKAETTNFGTLAEVFAQLKAKK